MALSLAMAIADMSGVAHRRVLCAVLMDILDSIIWY